MSEIKTPVRSEQHYGWNDVAWGVRQADDSWLIRDAYNEATANAIARALNDRDKLVAKLRELGWRMITIEDDTQVRCIECCQIRDTSKDNNGHADNCELAKLIKEE